MRVYRIIFPIQELEITRYQFEKLKEAIIPFKIIAIHDVDAPPGSEYGAVLNGLESLERK